MPSTAARPGARTERRVHTVSEVNAAARLAIEEALGRVWIEGEVSNLHRPGSGHWYFSLKDADSRIRCAMFASRNRFVRGAFGNGMTVVVRARLSVYEARGEFQAVVEHVEPAGEGELRAAYERLREALSAEGLFAVERKRPLPAYPRHMGLVSSAAGAAPRDVIAGVRRRFPGLRITWFQVAVQGDMAAGEVLTALDRAERMRNPPDVVVLARGGGSLEDLWTFNTESVVRRVAASSIPVVAAIGHETDVTLCDFAADRRAATPSAAAEMVTPDRDELTRRLQQLQRGLVGGATRVRRDRRRALVFAARRLVDPRRALEQRQQRADDLSLRLANAMAGRFEAARLRLDHGGRLLRGQSPLGRIGALTRDARRCGRRLHQAMVRATAEARRSADAAARALHAVSPLTTLERGYAIVVKDDARARGDGRWGVPVTSIDQVEAGERVRAHLADGTVEATVTGKGERPS